MANKALFGAPVGFEPTVGQVGDLAFIPAIRAASHGGSGTVRTLIGALERVGNPPSGPTLLGAPHMDVSAHPGRADYLAEHPRATDPTAPLWPNRALGGSRRRGCRAVAPLDFSEPVDTTAFYTNVFALPWLP